MKPLKLIDNEKIKLLSIRLTLTADGFAWKEFEWDATEKKSIYSICSDTENNLTLRDGWQEKERRIKKERLMIPDNTTYDTHKFISYSIWCLPHQKEEAKAKLDTLIRKLVTVFKTETDKLFAHL